MNLVLIITSNEIDARNLKSALAEAKDGPFATECVTLLNKALALIEMGGIDVILLDVDLADSQGIRTFDTLYALSPQIPIMILCAEISEPLAIEAVERGAQGYLLKGHFASNLVPQYLRNIIQRKAVEESMSLVKARAEVTLNSISDAVIGTDVLGHVDYLNAAAERMTGWTKIDAIGHSIHEVMQIVDGETREPKENPIDSVLKLNKPTALSPGTILIHRLGGEMTIEDSASPIQDVSGKNTGAVIVFHDTSVQNIMAAKMEHLAQHDFLTSLPNRRLLNDRIGQAISYAKRHETNLAALFLDLDNFKHINDSLGHEIGDKLLQSVAERLTSCVRGSDTVSRQGGDEFVVLVMFEQDIKDVALTCEKILTALTSPHFIDDQELHITTSLGISIYPDDGMDAESLIKNADTAMYHAKAKGRNNFQFFKYEMNVRAVERHMIETNLRRALGNNELILHYQPKVNLNTGVITGSEVLIRWMHPDWGMMSPLRFINIAEDSGLIIVIGNWVLNQACIQLKKWQEAGLDPGTVAVNISAVEFRHKDFVKGLSTILADTCLDPSCLQLEITETVLMRDAKVSNEILTQIKKMGVQLAVDDFGTGYSSLSYLNQFPIDVLKIDQSFVQEIVDNGYEGIIVSAVIAMGKSLNLKVVAEGIEEEVQLAFLLAQHCEEGQGYIFSRPLGAQQFAELLGTGICMPYNEPDYSATVRV